MSYGANDPNGLPLGLPSILSLGLPPLVNPYPALNLDFIDNQTLDSRVTFSRGSQATLFDSTGTLKYAKHNLLLQSQTFQTTWTAAEASITTDATVAPNGTQTADKLVENTASGVSHRVIQTGAPLSASNSATLSFYAKAAERNIVRAQLYENASGGILTGFFDLSLGTVTSTSVTGTASGVSGTITLVGDGWYRCTLSGIPYTSGTLASVAFTLVSTGTTVVYTGDGTSGIFLWGAQLNLANIEGGVTSSLTTYYPTTTAAYYAPRFDYNPSTLQPLGLLIEEQRTNSFPNSNDFANATYWTVYGTAVATAGAATGPDGLTSASNLAGATSTTLGGDNIEESISISASTAYTFSVFVKSNGGTTVELRLRDSTGGSTSTATLTVTSAWQRISLTRTMAAGATSVRCIIGATNGDIFIYGAQLEAGALPTSYIPTTTTALTRNADNDDMTGSNFSSWYNASEGTLLVEYAVNATGYNGGAAALSDGTFNNRMIIRGITTTNTAASIGVESGSTQWNNGFGGQTTAATKFALAYKTNDIAFTRNGATPLTDTVANIPTVNQLRIGADADGTIKLNGTIRRIAFYPQRLPNTTLQALTA